MNIVMSWKPNGQASDIEIETSKELFNGHYSVKRHRLRHKTFLGDWGPWIVREQVVRRDATGVLLYDPLKDAVVLVEQFRVGPLGRENQPSPWLLEIPAGLNDHADPIAVGIREVKEETGLVLETLMPIGAYYTTPGGFSEKMYLFCGLVSSELAQGIHGLPEEGEEIQVVVLPFQTVWEALQAGLLTSSSTYIALQWLALNRGKLRK